jgi:hypothetical protein
MAKMVEKGPIGEMDEMKEITITFPSEDGGSSSN